MNTADGIAMGLTLCTMPSALFFLALCHLIVDNYPKICNIHIEFESAGRVQRSNGPMGLTGKRR
jgi:hypothetical protein